MLVRLLAEHRPDDGAISEEGTDDKACLEPPYDRDVLLPDLVVCRPEPAEPILDFVRRHRAR